MHRFRLTTVPLALLAMIAGSAGDAQAGCGCAKPPPPPAAVRPNVAYAGSPITIFSRTSATSSSTARP